MPPITIKGHPGQPAPVLPAMGLHSFHNDSPPFAGAAMDREPVPFDLGESLPAAQAQDQHHLQPPSQANGAGSPLADCGGSGSSIERDDAVSRARSRRLVSGYRFGNPPSPVEKLRQATGEMEEGPDTEGEVEASQQSDSPPLTDELSDEEDDSEVSAEVEALGSEMLPAQARAMAGLTLQQSRVPPSTLGAPPKRSERGVRGTAWDLKGLNDGEADADASALPAEHGSAEYLRGEGGPAGEYRFPKHRLRQKMKDESKIPLVIVACGSFSPPTYLHLRMFEMAKDEIVESQTYEIMAGYYSPVSSYYKKAGLAPAEHRVRMCELAVEHTSTWLMVDPWEAGQPEYQRTAVVLEHFDHLLNGENGGVTMSDGSRRKYKIMLLAGGDLIESFGEPGVWSEPDLHVILGRFGCLIVERAGSDVWAFLLSHDILYKHRRNVIVVKQLIYNDISSTKVRLFVRRGMSIKYLLPNSVIQYIHEHRLYRESDRKPVAA